MKKIIITLLCLAIVSGGGYYGYERYQKKKDSKRIVDVVPISLMTESYWADEMQLDGTVTSGNSQRVYLDSEKLVEELNVNVGDEVKKGDVILTYDMTVVELETEQKKNEIAVIKQQIKEEERELERIKKLLPSELAPNESYDEPWGYEEPDNYEEPEEPEGPGTFIEPSRPVRKLGRLTSIDQASERTADGAFVFQCSFDTEVSTAFMGMLKTNRTHALLYVYDESDSVVFFWDISGAAISESDVEEWVVGDGVEFDGDSVYFDSEKAKAHGIFKGYDPTAEDNSEEDGGYDDYIPDDDTFDDTDIYDDTDEPYYEDDKDEDVSENYMYSRAELAAMVREKETEIKELKIELKSAKLEYKNSLSRKEDGKVTAEIDGIVVKIGTDSSAADENMYYDDDGVGYEDEYGGASGGESDSAYIVIQGKEGICIDISVGELNLDKFEIGTVVNAMSWETGESFTAEVIDVKEEPQYYYTYMWNENPNSSTYTVTASVIEDTSLAVNNWVSVTMPQSETGSSGLYIPMHYTHKDSGGYYVMKDKDGKLSKQYLNTGKVIWGSYIEVKGGISYDDMICFPYGKDVKEGVKTRKSEEVLY